MKQQIKDLVSRGRQEMKNALSAKELFDIKVKLLGKNGELTHFLKQLKDVPEDKRPEAGKIVNEARIALETEFGECNERCERIELDKKLESERIDITVPAPCLKTGRLQPMNVIKNKITDFFIGYGFSVVESPEIEYVLYNFDRLNIPKDHPTREVQDTFYINDDIILRTQTSPGQARVMEKAKPPIKIISPGRVFRPDEVDATHSPCFHQLEGLVVDKNITLCDLKGMLERFAKSFFSESTEIRFRPSYFPFTEPSVEVDATCHNCGGVGCNVCKGTGWIEIIGAGIVSRNVLLDSNVDPDIYTGYAFGMGLDRITAIIHGITDARIPFEGDIRFLKQF